MSASIRDRPFNLQGGLWFFVLFRFFFLGQLESYNIYFFCRAKRIFFSQNSTLGYMTNTLNQIFFSSTKIRIFFQQHNFLEKNIPAPPFQVKWSFPYWMQNRHLTLLCIVVWWDGMPCWNSGQTLVTNQQYAPEG